MAVTNASSAEQFCLEVFSVKLHGELIFLAVVNMFVSITAFLGNTLILVALHRESSRRPPFASIVLYRNLAITDLCVGILVEPTYIAYLMSLMDKRYDICHYTRVTCFLTTSVLCAVSFLTLTAISVDRLFVVFLRLRYRQVASSKRKVITVIVFWILSIVGASQYFWDPVLKAWLFGRTITFLCVITSIFSYTKVFFNLRHNQVDVQNSAARGQLSQAIPGNIARYKKTVYSALWVQAALLFCYLPVGIVVALTPQRGPVPVTNYLARQFALTLVYLNSSLNPLLYCWKIREVKRAVKATIRQLLFLST